MYEAILKHVNQHIAITEKEEDYFKAVLVSAKIAKRKKLVQPSTFVKHEYFVVKGCLIGYYLDDKEINILSNLLLKIGGLVILMHFIMVFLQNFTLKLLKIPNYWRFNMTIYNNCLKPFQNLNAISGFWLQVDLFHCKDEYYHHFKIP